MRVDVVGLEGGVGRYGYVMGMVWSVSIFGRLRVVGRGMLLGTPVSGYTRLLRSVVSVYFGVCLFYFYVE